MLIVLKLFFQIISYNVSIATKVRLVLRFFFSLAGLLVLHLSVYALK